MSEPPILVLLDDEDMVVASIRALFELETDYVVRAFTSASKALAFIRDNDVDVVVSDYLMPEMDGLQFLSAVRKIRPEVPRIILTGYADKANAIRAINEIGLYQYLEKPWSNDDLQIVVRNGIEKKQLIDRLNSKLREVGDAYAELRGIQQEVLKAFA